MLAAKSDSRRSPEGAALMSSAEPGSRRSPGGAALADGGSAVGSGCGYFIPNNHLIKMHVPTLRSLLQSINGSLKLAYLGSSVDINPSGCIIYTSLVRDRKSTRLNSSHSGESRMPSSA